MEWNSKSMCGVQQNEIPSAWGVLWTGIAKATTVLQSEPKCLDTKKKGEQSTGGANVKILHVRLTEHIIYSVMQ